MDAEKTPPFEAADTPEFSVPQSNGKAVPEFHRALTSLTVAGLVGLFALLWSVHGRLTTIEATMVTQAALIQTIRQESPPQWFRDEVRRIQATLDDHVRSTGDAAHRSSRAGGGP